jgi:2-haloacid dehalogenase
MPAEVVAFDALGTLFDLGDLARSLELRRVLHHAAALTLAGEWAPFAELAAAVDAELPEQLAGLGPYPEAAEALEIVRGAGMEPWVLTNGGRESTERLLARAGLAAEVHSVEEVRWYKPHPAVYELLPLGAILVAAHGWDVAGARAAGYRAVWIDREEGEWPLPLPQPELRASDLVEAARLATSRS